MSAPVRDIPYLGLLEVAGRIRAQTLTSERVTQALLARIDAHDGRLHSYALVMGELAIEQARQADVEIVAGQWRGPLHGVPVAVKDLLDIAGVPTAAGTDILKDTIPDVDATVVTRLRRAGAVVLGKLHMTEAATLAHHPSLPRPDNPWRSGYWTGVSSSGSGVATAAGLCFGSLGSDTGGSIRMPSYACGLSSFKPTWGRVSRHGVFPLAETFDHIGPMARSVADAAAMLGVIAGQDPADPTALADPVPDYLARSGVGLEGLSLGVDWAVAEDGVEAVVVENMRAAVRVFESLGARVRSVSLPPLGALAGAAMPLMIAEVMVAHAATYPLQADRYGPALRGMLEGGAGLTAMDVARATHARAAFAGALRKVFDEVDLLLLPAAPAPTPTWDELEDLGGDVIAVLDRVGRFTFPFNVSGSPTLSLPSGFTGEGLPLGLQLVGPHLGEALLTTAGCAFQRVTDFHTVHPDLG
jgi:amidase